jgi:hypothetical protein
MRTKSFFLITSLVIIAQILSCTWVRTRKFILPEESAAEKITGWTFKPDVQAYHLPVKKGAPKDINGLWLNLTAFHSKAAEMDTIYGVDIDTVYMIYGKSESQRHTWIKHASAYGDVLEYKRLVNRFRFRNPSGEYYFIVPPDVDTLCLEFNAKFYRGIYKTLSPNPEYSTKNDTIAVDTANPESFTRSVRMKLIHRESKTLVPSFI